MEESKFETIEKKLKQWPDYMSSGCPSRLKIHESDHILGKLYRNVDCKTLYKLCIEGDHTRSVNLEYSINWFILGDERSFRTGQVPDWHQHTCHAYEKFVIPLEEELHKIMVQYKILNEGELFCTTLSYNLDDEKL